MQNSKLTTKILPSITESWEHFIRLVATELEQLKQTNRKNSSRSKELLNHISKIDDIKRLCETDASKILEHRVFLLYIDPTLENSFDALEFFKEQDNLDNDAVRIIYNKIINSPEIVKLNEKYHNLMMKLNFANDQTKPLEELIRGKKLDQNLIIELLDKYNLDDKTKKDVLLYAMVKSAVKQDEVKNNKETTATLREEKAKLYREKIKELCEIYRKIDAGNNSLYDKLFAKIQNMSSEEKAICKAYSGKPSEAKQSGFDDIVMLKVYITALFRLREEIEEYIDSLAEVQMEKTNLKDDIDFLKEEIDEYDNILTEINNLMKDEKQVEDDEEDINVFFAVDAFRRPLIDTDLLENNHKSINAFIEKARYINNNLIEGINVTSMLGVQEAEELLSRNVYLVSSSNYKLAYIVVNNSIFVIGMAERTDEKFDRSFVRLVKDNRSTLRNQIVYIKEKDKDYIDLQRYIRERYLEKEEKVL